MKKLFVYSIIVLVACFQLACLEKDNPMVPLKDLHIEKVEPLETELKNELGGSDFGNPGLDPDLSHLFADFTGTVPSGATSAAHDCDKEDPSECPGTEWEWQCTSDTVRATDVKTSNVISTNIEKINTIPPGCLFIISLEKGHNYLIECLKDGKVIETAKFVDGSVVMAVTEDMEVENLGMICGGVEKNPVETEDEDESPPSLQTILGQYMLGGSVGPINQCPTFNEGSLNIVTLGLDTVSVAGNAIRAHFNMPCPTPPGAAPSIIVKAGILTGTYSDSSNFIIEGQQMDCSNKEWNISCNVNAKKLSTGTFAATCTLRLVGGMAPIQTCMLDNYVKQ